MATADSYLARFEAFEELLYARRYSAVAFTHPQLEHVPDVAVLIEDLEGVSAVHTFRVDGWSVARAAFAVPRNYFTKIDDSAVAVGDHYVQEAYVAMSVNTSKSNQTATSVVILAPYVRLLNRLLTRAGRILQGSRLQYQVPDMNAVFKVFEGSSLPGMAATRISVRDKREPAVELVSLTGRNPLKSNLRAELRKVGPGYSIRVEVQTSGGPVSVHLDRFGNYWWYHRADANLSGPLRLIGTLNAVTDTRLDTNRPTLRIGTDD